MAKRRRVVVLLGGVKACKGSLPGWWDFEAAAYTRMPAASRDELCEAVYEAIAELMQEAGRSPVWEGLSEADINVRSSAHAGTGTLRLVD